MEDKMVNYLITNAIATNRCLNDIQKLSKAVLKQAKINKKQRFTNMVLGGLVVACVCNIADLIKTVNAQNARIKELEEKVNGNETKGE